MAGQGTLQLKTAVHELAVVAVVGNAVLAVYVQAAVKVMHCSVESVETVERVVVIIEFGRCAQSRYEIP